MYYSLLWGIERLSKAFLLKYGKDILRSDNFKKTKEHIQHGDVSVHQHCLNVANVSMNIKNFLHIRCNERDLIRGALLHDYFLYDWHYEDEENPHKWHGFYHPGTALKNAKKEFEVTRKQEDIIKHHMWPLTIKPPKCREAWIVTMADKYCSTLETLHVIHGSKRRGKSANNKVVIR